MDSFYERTLGYSQILYERALMRADSEEFKKAEFAATVSLGSATLLVNDEETPPHIRAKAKLIEKASKGLLSELWKAQIEGYGEHFLSGRKSREDKFAEECVDELRAAVRAIGRKRS